MTARHDMIDMHDTVRVLGTQCLGTVRAIHLFAEAEPSFTVAYTDAAGSPQKRDWGESELVLVQKAPAEDAETDEDDTDNVIPFARAN